MCCEFAKKFKASFALKAESKDSTHRFCKVVHDTYTVVGISAAKAERRLTPRAKPDSGLIGIHWF